MKTVFARLFPRVFCGMSGISNEEGPDQHPGSNDDHKAAHAAFVAKAKKQGYTPVKHSDGLYAHPTWSANTRRVEMERRQRFTGAWRYAS